MFKNCEGVALVFCFWQTPANVCEIFFLRAQISSLQTANLQSKHKSIFYLHQMKNYKIWFPQNFKGRYITSIKVPLQICFQQDNFYFIRFLKLEKRNVLLNQNCIMINTKRCHSRAKVSLLHYRNDSKYSFCYVRAKK